MVYVKTALNPVEEIAQRAGAILNHCHAISLADLSGKLGMAMERVMPALGDMVTRGVVEELRPVGRRVERSGRSVTREMDRYYRWIRESDGDFEWQRIRSESEQNCLRCAESWPADRIC